MSNYPTYKVTELEEQFRERGLYDKDFKWRGKDGTMHRVSDMVTRHIFYACLMIWNHAAPEHLKSNMGHRYSEFNGFYTPMYMLKAFANLYIKLKSIPDLDPEFSKEVTRIEAFFWVRSGHPFDGDSFKLLDENKVKL